MLSHWYNHDNLGNSLKTNVKTLNIASRLNPTQVLLKVPEVKEPNKVIPSTQCSNSSLSMNSSQKGSFNNLRDSMPSYRVPWKIVLFGDAGVGKTSLIKQYLNGSFNDLYTPTIEDNYLHNIILKDGSSQCVEILDTSGLYHFPAMKELNIRAGNAFILVFDLTKDETVKSVMNMRKNIIEIKGSESIPIVLVGNKKDLVEESFSNFNLSKKVSKLAIDEELYVVETSAKNNLNINEIFNSVVDLIVKDLWEKMSNKDSKEQSANTSRRNSSLSFVRHMSVSNLEKRFSVSRRYSEPASAELSCKSNKRTNSKLIEAVIEKRDLDKKCSKKHHQKNCIIS